MLRTMKSLLWLDFNDLALLVSDLGSCAHASMCILTVFLSLPALEVLLFLLALGLDG